MAIVTATTLGMRHAAATDNKWAWLCSGTNSFAKTGKGQNLTHGYSLKTPHVTHYHFIP